LTTRAVATTKRKRDSNNVRLTYGSAAVKGLPTLVFFFPQSFNSIFLFLFVLFSLLQL